MYEEMRLDQAYSGDDYFHLDIKIAWLRGVKLHRDVRFKFFRDKQSAGLEFRSIPGWPTMFQVWPGHLVDQHGPYFVISTRDAERQAIARLDEEGMTLVSDIAADLFSIVAKLSNDPAAEITDASTLLREVIRLCEYIAPEKPSNDRPPLLISTLQPIAAILQENLALLKELQAPPFTEEDFGILESYLAKIRRDGAPQHLDMKQKLVQVAENNTAIVTLIKAYAPHAKTAAFSSEGGGFRNYASAWRDRWNCLIELVMAGENYAPSGVPFPQAFPAAVDAEIAATMKRNPPAT